MVPLRRDNLVGESNMARIFYVELSDSGYALPYLVIHNSEGEVRKKMKEFVQENRIGNGYAKINLIKEITGTPVSEGIFRLSKETIINTEQLQQ